MSILRAQEIERKRHIPDDVRTPFKDEAADYLEREVIEKGRWPMHLTEIADECDWSRQHIKNTLDDYFKEVGDDEPSSGRRLHFEVDIPDDITDEKTFLRGYVQGWMHSDEKGQT